MAYRLRMSGEIRDWLVGLPRDDPPAAMQVGPALLALMTEGARLGPPLVVSLARAARPADPREALDLAYQERLEGLHAVRRAGADAATLARDIEAEIASLEAARPGEAGQSQLAELRRLLPGVAEAERQLIGQSQRRQARVDAFRKRKEVLKARYTAALAECEIGAAMRAAAQAGVADPEGESAAGPGGPGGPAAGRLAEITGAIERELGPGASADDLLELRPALPAASAQRAASAPPSAPGLRAASDPPAAPGLPAAPGPAAPAGNDIRVIFAVEPAGTALLIAVIEGSDAVRDRRREAVTASADLLRSVRAGQAPEAAACGYDDAQAFGRELFGGQAALVEAAAAALLARARARTLAEQRARLGLSRDQVAERMGVPPERVAAIERAEPGAADVPALAGYVEALGGRLDILADFGDEGIQPLRLR